ncbi:MAG: FAD-dependent oxidoreductase [Sphaerochaetaceae bacterium]
MQRSSERFGCKSFELVVVGGGMAGLCAAIEAARDGVKVALINSRPVLGGNASSEIRVHISGADQSLKQSDYAESGLLYELMLENKARNENFSYSVWDMILYEAATQEKNLTLFMNTVMYDCQIDGNTIKSVMCVQETTEMRYCISAPLFVDATGNGTLGYYAGAEYRQGSESKAETGELDAPKLANNERLGNTIMYKAVDMGHPVKFTPPSFAKKYTEHDLRYRMHCNTQKVDFSGAKDAAENERTGGVSSRGNDYGFFWIELSGDKEDIITESEDIRDDLLGALYGVWDHIKNGGDHGAENLALEWVGAFPGTRESRRLVGDYLLDETDILENRDFDDVVAYGGWCVDLHAPHGLLDTDILPSGECRYFKGVYGIPYRCYYSKNINNLFLAGRDISATKLGFASTRIIGTCAVGGQAVGVAAALCGKYGVLPRALAPHIHEVQQILLKHDAFIPNCVNQDSDDYALKAAFTASSCIAGGEPQRVVDGISRRIGSHMHGWISDGISPDGEKLVMTLGGPKMITQMRYTFDASFGNPIRVTMSPNRQAQQRIGVPIELVRDFNIVFKLDGKVVDTISVRDNHQRVCVVDVEPTECDCVELDVLATNGDGKVVVFEVRAY